MDFLSDDGTVKPDSGLAMWGKLCREAGKKMGKTFMMIEEGVQTKGMEAAGFAGITVVDKKVRRFYSCPRLETMPRSWLTRR